MSPHSAGGRAHYAIATLPGAASAPRPASECDASERQSPVLFSKPRTSWHMAPSYVLLARDRRSLCVGIEWPGIRLPQPEPYQVQPAAAGTPRNTPEHPGTPQNASPHHRAADSPIPALIGRHAHILLWPVTATGESLFLPCARVGPVHKLR